MRTTPRANRPWDNSPSTKPGAIHTHSDSTDAGKLRTTPVVIGSPTGSVIDSRFVPMPPGPGLAAAVNSLVEWIAQSERAVDPLVAAGMAHYQFETLHPFNDGNGRIGRLLIVLHFLQTGLLHHPLLSVSPWFKHRRAEYQEFLAEVSASGDWDGWLTFFARGVEQSAIDTAQRGYIDRVVQSGARGGTVRDIAEMLIENPWVTVPLLAARVGKTQQAVNTAVRRLVELGILRGPFGNYNRMFYAPEVWDIIRAQ